MRIKRRPTSGQCRTRTNGVAYRFKTVKHTVYEIYGPCDRKIERAEPGDIELTSESGDITYLSPRAFYHHFIISPNN